MRRNDLRTHAIAIGSISLVIIISFLAMRPKHDAATTEQKLMGDRYIQIYSATWGENCNQYIQEALARPPAPTRDEKGILVPPKLPSPVLANNVLDALNAACNGEIACELKANSETLMIEPLQNCYKELHVSYRCYTLDRLWPTTTRQGDTLKINCSAETPETENHAAPTAAHTHPQ